LSELERQDVAVLVDLSRGEAGLELVRGLRAERPSTLMFALVDTKRPDLTIEALLAGAADVFARPLGGRSVANAIDRERRYESAEFDGALDASGDALYAHSPAMREVMTLIDRASATRGGVVIRGEAGTGRQVAARAIHATQHGNPDPFVVVDCARFDSTELDVHLFGQSARSTNGDQMAHGLERVSLHGQLHAATNGTLYLQNVADASTRVQARLARVLRDREAILVESGSPIGVDVQAMASVDPNIDSAVREGRVRDDLYRRLSVTCIEMPPLRHRREDIPALANYFLRDVCASLHVPPKAFSRAALSLMAALPWRGNGLELRTFIENVVSGLPAGRGIVLEDVLAHVRLDGGPVVVAGGTLRQARASFEREYIAAVLEQHQGRISDAAKTLGIQRTNLYRKLRSLRVAGGRRTR
jgi:DNA-binding NtrC family response regulator